MTTEYLPWPVPDPRVHYFVSQYADMHAQVEDLVVPDGAPAAAASMLTTTRELLRHSYFRYEFSTVAVLYSLIAVEAVLRDRLPNAEKKPLHRLIAQAATDGLITAEQADVLDTGRKIRNGMAHGQTTHTAMPPAMAVPMVRTSFRIVAELCAAAPAAPPP